MRTAFLLSSVLALAAAAPGEEPPRVAFALPDACCGRVLKSADIDARYVLLVYQGVP